MWKSRGSFKPISSKPYSRLFKKKKDLKFAAIFVSRLLIHFDDVTENAKELLLILSKKGTSALTQTLIMVANKISSFWNVLNIVLWVNCYPKTTSYYLDSISEIVVIIAECWTGNKSMFYVNIKKPTLCSLHQYYVCNKI